MAHGANFADGCDVGAAEGAASAVNKWRETAKYEVVGQAEQPTCACRPHGRARATAHSR